MKYRSTNKRWRRTLIIERTVASRRMQGGFSLVEITLVAFLIGILFIPFTSLIKKTMVAVFVTESRTSRQSVAFQGQTLLNRDFRELNEVLFGGSTRIVFILDRFRFNDPDGPGFNPKADQDGDGFNNDEDPDDDGDGFAGINGPGPGQVKTARDLIASPQEGWRQGLDLEDDDDDNDGQCDVRCEYAWNPDAKTVERRMSFNGGAWTKPVILFDHVTSCQFNYFGRADTPGSPVADDTDGNGFFNQAELDLMDGVADGTLDQFEETRWISGIDYRFDILTNTGAAPYVVSGKVSPRLMEAKGKFFR